MKHESTPHTASLASSATPHGPSDPLSSMRPSELVPASKKRLHSLMDAEVNPLTREKKSTIISSTHHKKITSHLQRWSAIQGELANAPDDDDDDAHPDVQGPINNTEMKEPEPVDLSDDAILKKLPSDAQMNEQYSDLKLIACLLCQRQFKASDDLTKHQVKSELHKTNMGNLRQTQISELRTTLSIQAAAEQARYRNRIEDRSRRMTPEYNHSSHHARREKSESKFVPIQQSWKSIPPVIPVEQPTINGIKEDNAGRKLLEKMGWKEGEGLGAKKDGITIPITAAAYSKGAGLGSVGGTYSDDGTYTESYQAQSKRLARGRMGFETTDSSK
ncbi:hypothetical protein SeMB42_g05798 [Synchytrium endobioticum]|uniref:G-patch domain-containing protein n=1 Tax=Synchytrium endobioticum TaxID=286115 RepID=A0A507CPC8_9FUNG|nr:hypothetical protein SeMB42_g05798 [Synchytrium endobioticum]